ncbi:MAG: hypothetical protein IT348_11130 [Candidatus Eisenbacteria bacterium]|nr:hypothetical protein [Candidatus Eisenbacteria bacterium]
MSNTEQKKNGKNTPKLSGRKRADEASSLPMQVEALRSEVTKMNGTLAGLQESIKAVSERLLRAANEWRPGDKCWVSNFDGLVPDEPYEGVVLAVRANALEVMHYHMPLFAFLSRCFRTQEAAEADVQWLRAVYEAKFSKRPQPMPPPKMQPPQMPRTPQTHLSIVRDT